MAFIKKVADKEQDNKAQEDRKPSHNFVLASALPQRTEPQALAKFEITPVINNVPVVATSDSLVDKLSGFLGRAGEMTTEPRTGKLVEIMRAAIDNEASLPVRDDAAMLKALDAAENGENVVEIAKSYGITDPQSIEELERAAAVSAGFALIDKDASLEQICSALGISNPACIEALKRRMAINEIQYGTNVRTIAQKFNISDPDVIKELEIEATATIGLDMVSRGADVDTVIEQLGIDDADCIRMLKEHAD